jgi:hypothetical protein
MNKPLIFCEHEGDKNSYESYAETIYDDRIVPLIHIDFFNMADKIVRTENFNHVVKKLSQREPGKRGVYLRGLFWDRTRPGDMNQTAALKIFREGRLPIEDLVEYLTELAEMLYDNKIELDIIHSNVEANLSWWTLNRTPFYMDAVVDKLSKKHYPSGLIPTGWFGDPLFQQKLSEFDTRASNIVSFAIGDMLRRSNLVSPITLYTNNMSMVGEGITDLNGWRNNNEVLPDGKTSGAMVYDTGMGQRYDRFGWAGNRGWTGLCEDINVSRTCTSLRGDNRFFVPTICSPTFLNSKAGQFHIEARIAHMLRNGSPAIIYWRDRVIDGAKPENCKADDRFVADAWERHVNAARGVQTLVPIRHQTEVSFATRGYVTKLEDLEKAEK